MNKWWLLGFMAYPFAVDVSKQIKYTWIKAVVLGVGFGLMIMAWMVFWRIEKKVKTKLGRRMDALYEKNELLDRLMQASFPKEK